MYVVMLRERGRVRERERFEEPFDGVVPSGCSCVEIYYNI